ncbi:MAG TPA: hypothetical protein VKV26_19465 [Dehalococcoidia bacterium]|nr:hypothetical protein [Dehalococcoidia bacterium]
MYCCVICHFAVPLDDTVISGRTGRCICLRCYVRETGSEQTMPAWLTRDLRTTLSAIGGD